MLQNILNSISPEFALDLGSSHAHIYLKGQGIVAKEASYVSYEHFNNSFKKMVAIGNKSKALRGRTSANVKTINPLVGGCINDFDLAQKMLKQLVNDAAPKSRVINSKVVMSLPTNATELEKKSLVDAVQSACNGKVYTIARQIAAAVGAGLHLSDCSGAMIIDIGASSTEVAVVSMDGIVVSKTIKAGGNNFDYLISEYLRKRFSLLIGETTAEDIKIKLATAKPNQNPKSIEVHGRSLLSGMPASATISELDIYNAIKDSFLYIADLIRKTLDETPPEIAADLMEAGAILTGGGSLIAELDSLLSEKTSLNIVLVEEPQTVVVEGAGKVLENWSEYTHLLRAQ